MWRGSSLSSGLFRLSRVLFYCPVIRLTSPTSLSACRSARIDAGLVYSFPRVRSHLYDDLISTVTSLTFRLVRNPPPSLSSNAVDGNEMNRPSRAQSSQVPDSGPDPVSSSRSSRLCRLCRRLRHRHDVLVITMIRSVGDDSLLWDLGRHGSQHTKP